MTMPKMNPEEVASRVLKVCDDNQDGVISGEELSQCEALARADSDRDGVITREEVKARAQFWIDEGTALTPAKCRIRQRGRPVVGAQVVFDPDEFMGGAVEQATGVTDSYGEAVMSIPEEYVPSANYVGVRCGYYRVLVTLPNESEPRRTEMVEVAGDLINEITINL